MKTLASPAPAATAQTMIGFRAGDWSFLLPIALHCEVIEAVAINPLPRVEPWFCGLLNLRGNIVPVLDLCRLPGVSTEAAKKRYLLAIGKGSKTTALWIDEYPKMMPPPTNPQPNLPPLPQQLRPCVIGAYRQQDRLWLEVRFDALFKALGGGQKSQEETP